MKLPKFTGNWELKILALVLAIVTYYALKPSSSHSANSNDDNRFFHYR